MCPLDSLFRLQQSRPERSREESTSKLLQVIGTIYVFIAGWKALVFRSCQREASMVPAIPAHAPHLDVQLRIEPLVFPSTFLLSLVTGLIQS